MKGPFRTPGARNGPRPFMTPDHPQHRDILTPGERPAAPRVPTTYEAAKVPESLADADGLVELDRADGAGADGGADGLEQVRVHRTIDAEQHHRVRPVSGLADLRG